MYKNDSAMLKEVINAFICIERMEYSFSIVTYNIFNLIVTLDTRETLIKIENVI